MDTERNNEIEPWQNLANAIVARAAQDYAQAIVDQDMGAISSCERFFKGGWCSELTLLDGVLIMTRIARGAEEFVRLAEKSLSTDSFEKPFKAFECPICGERVKGRMTRKITHIGTTKKEAFYYKQVQCIHCELVKRKFLYSEEVKK